MKKMKVHRMVDFFFLYGIVNVKAVAKMYSNNQQPNYVLRFNETDSRKVKDSNYFIRKALGIIIAIIVVSSIIFGENIFLELSWTARIYGNEI